MVHLHISSERFDSLFFISSVQVGESKLVLEIGRRSLQHPDAKPYTDDLLLSMALAEVRHGQRGQEITFSIYCSLVMYHFLIIGAFLKCAIAKIGFEKNKVSQGFEALARAQHLLRSKPSLAKITLLCQVRNYFEVYIHFRSLRH